MDTRQLLACFSGTLEANQAVRRDSEAQLRSLVHTPGFLDGCLDIISNHSSDISSPVRKAAAVYLKNHIVRKWNVADQAGIAHQDRISVRGRILPTIVAVDHQLKQQLVPVLRTLISKDFPNNWHSLLADTGELLQQVPQNDGDDQSFLKLYTGILAFAEISRKFRWATNKERALELSPILVVFPHLLSIGKSILSSPEAITEVRAEMLKLILKAYKFVTYFDLPDEFQSPESFSAWGELHGLVINAPTPAYVQNYDDQERSLLEFSKAVKWSIANLYRLFTRYASESLSRKFTYTGFQDTFTTSFLPHLISNYLGAIDQWCHHKKWLPRPALFHLLQFLSHAVTQKPSWPMLQPYADTLVSHFVFPLVCPSESDLEMFDSDPLEYIHTNFDVYDEFNTPDIAALGFLASLVLKRKKATLEPTMTYIYTQLSQLQNDGSLDGARKKDGLFRMIGALTHYITARSLPFYPQMEQFVGSMILPSLQSEHEFLRARTLEVVQKFSELEFNDDHLVAQISQGILTNFDSSSLPVQLEAALGIQTFLHLDLFKLSLAQVIVPTMLKLLALLNDIDNDAIPVVMQECVENFAEQLQPFGVELMEKLTAQLLRLVTEIHQASQVDVDDYDGTLDQLDKVMAAVGLLNTVITVLLSFENLYDICIKLEQVFAPVVEFVLVNMVDDFFGEVAELMENSVFLLRAVTPTMWTCFHHLFACFQDGVALMYFEEFIPCLHNFLLYGKEELLRTPDLANQFFKIYTLVFEGDANAIGLNDLAFACEMAQTFILTLQTEAHRFTAHFVSSTIDTYTTVKSASMVGYNKFDVNMHDVVLAALVYDTNNVLQLLHQKGALVLFFQRWFKLIPELRRVFDLKLSLLALIAVISSAETPLIDPILAHAGQALAQIMERMPELIAELEKKRKNFTEGASQFDHADFDDATDDEASDNDNYVEFDGDLDHDTSDYLQFLKLENSKLKHEGYYSDDEDQVTEDPLSTNPLEPINVFEVFKNFASQLLPDMQVAVFGNLTNEQRATLETVVGH